MYVLVVEDDARMAHVLKALFEDAGWRVDVTSTAFDAVEYLLSGAYDCAVVDVELPDGNGMEMVSNLRQLGVKLPVLMLTVHGELADRVAGLNAGADDYVVKPFAPEELMARVHALVRRAAHGRMDFETIRYGEAVLHRPSRTLQFRGRSLHLSQKEYDLLEVLFRNAGQVIPRDELIARLWGPDTVVADNALDTYVYFLRKKFDKLGLHHVIHTVRGQGFMVPSAPVQSTGGG
jgi:DNA-binding response OmpR family regulator